MNVVGYDPKISVDAAWRLPNSVGKLASLEEAFAQADYVTINMPYIKGARAQHRLEPTAARRLWR